MRKQTLAVAHQAVPETTGSVARVLGPVPGPGEIRWATYTIHGSAPDPGTGPPGRVLRIRNRHHDIDGPGRLVAQSVSGSGVTWFAGEEIPLALDPDARRIAGGDLLVVSSEPLGSGRPDPGGVVHIRIHWDDDQPPGPPPGRGRHPDDQPSP